MCCNGIFPSKFLKVILSKQSYIFKPDTFNFTNTRGLGSGYYLFVLILAILRFFPSFLFSQDLKQWLGKMFGLYLWCTLYVHQCRTHATLCQWFTIPWSSCSRKEEYHDTKGKIEPNWGFQKILFAAETKNKTASFSILLLLKSVKEQIKISFLWKELIYIWK